MAAVFLDNLSKTFKDFFGRRRVHALDGLSLSIDKGEVFGVLGPIGSGKSTAFKILVGLLRPDSGPLSGLKCFEIFSGGFRRECRA